MKSHIITLVLLAFTSLSFAHEIESESSLINQRSVVISVVDAGYPFYSPGFSANELELDWFVNGNRSVVTNGLTDMKQWVPFEDRLIEGQHICTTVESLGVIGDYNVPYYKILKIEDSMDECSGGSVTPLQSNVAGESLVVSNKSTIQNHANGSITIINPMIILGDGTDLVVFGNNGSDAARGFCIAIGKDGLLDSRSFDYEYLESGSEQYTVEFNSEGTAEKYRKTQYVLRVVSCK